jgi:hypothetical protein
MHELEEFFANSLQEGEVLVHESRKLSNHVPILIKLIKFCLLYNIILGYNLFYKVK